MRMLVLAISILIAIGVPPVYAAPPSTTTPTARPQATRADLALEYLRFERALAAHPPTGETLARIGRGFDDATTSFFRGGFGSTIRQLQELTELLVPQTAAPDERDRRIAGALSASIDPPVLDRTGDAAPVLELRLLYAPRPRASDPDEPAPPRIIVQVAPSAAPEAPIAELELTLDSWPALPGPRSLELDAAALAPGAYEVRLGPRGGALRTTARWFIVDGSLDAQRERYLRRLGDLAAGSPGAAPDLEAAREVFRQRSALLTDTPSTVNAPQFLADQSALAPALERELAAIEAGVNPYRDHPGDLWRPFSLAEPGATVAARVYNPPADGAEPPPRPLVIALHGAGGDENMFMDAYGAGEIKRLADQHGFLVVSPRTNPFASNPQFFDGLVAAIGADYRFDPSRVYVLGHSMGAGVASAWARARPDRIAAAAAIAGFPPARSPENGPAPPPMLVLAAEFDGIIPTSRVRPAAEAAIESGLPVEFRLVPDHGHTTVVGAVLPEAVRWLLGHDLDAAP